MIDPSELVRAYLANVQTALASQQYKQAEALLQHVLTQIIPEHTSFQRPVPFSLSCGIGLDRGIKRAERPNEDYPFAYTGILPATGERYGLFIVADGMGGHANGQEASSLAIHTLVDSLLPCLLMKQQPGGAQMNSLLETSIQEANTAVYKKNRGIADPQLRMGTTITAALVIDACVVIANVGDSRTYLFRPGAGLVQITHDHSTVARLVERGVIALSESYTHPKRNEIYRSLGSLQKVEVDIYQEPLSNGDVLLLCSDGLWEMTRSPSIEAILADRSRSAEQMTQDLVRLALQSGGLDNIAVIVTQVAGWDIAAQGTLFFSSFTRAGQRIACPR